MDSIFLDKKILEFPSFRCNKTDKAIEQISVPNVVLHRISNKISNERSNSIFSSVFTLCYRVAFLFGISSSCYCLFKLWFIFRRRFEKVEKKENERLNEFKHIKKELEKVVQELKKYQTLERNQTDILKEINSLKAIFLSRKYFEEKQSSSFSIPSWQLSQNSTKPSKSPIENEKLLDDASNSISPINSPELSSQSAKVEQ